MNPLPILAACAVILAGYGFYCRIQYRRELRQFRASLRVGDSVRVKLPNGSTVPARIVVRNSAISFEVREIDNKSQRLTSVDFIYMS